MLAEPGAEGSRGALRVEGNIVSVPWAHENWQTWAGAHYFFRRDQKAVDVSDLHELVFWARGDRKLCRAILFDIRRCRRRGCEGQQIPFGASPIWKKVRVPIASFADIDLHNVTSIHFGAFGPGAFVLELDRVELR
jgi:hypothetical protein